MKQILLWPVSRSRLAAKGTQVHYLRPLRSLPMGNLNRRLMMHSVNPGVPVVHRHLTLMLRDWIIYARVQRLS